MTREYYSLRKKELKEKLENDLTALAKVFALANNPYKIGDVVTDHMGPMRIEKINLYPYGDYPSCVYEGTELKKDGTPTKKQNHTTVWQSNIKTKSNDKV